MTPIIYKYIELTKSSQYIAKIYKKSEKNKKKGIFLFAFSTKWVIFYMKIVHYYSIFYVLVCYYVWGWEYAQPF